MSSKRVEKNVQRIDLIENPAFNLSYDAIGRSALIHPDNTALEIIGSPPEPPLKSNYSYKELDRIIRKMASGLINSGAEPGDMILIRLTSDTPFALTFFASIAAGLIPVPLSPLITEEECAYFVNFTKARWVALSPELNFPVKGNEHKIINEDKLLSFIQSETPLQSYAETKANDPAFLVFTSGTSNTPKAVLHAQRTIIGRRPMREGWHQIRQQDRVLHAGDFNWTYSLGVGLMDPWSVGAATCIYKGEKSPEFWPRLINNHNITIFAAVPGVYRQILKYAAFNYKDFNTLSHCLTAGEAMPKTLVNEWLEKTGTPIYEALGQSEISTYASTTNGMVVPRGAKGRIQQGRKVTILPSTENQSTSHTPLSPGESGQIAVHKSDPGLMLGYWQEGLSPEIPLIGEWFLTGDQGFIDAHGFLYHQGRADEIMNASGYRVSPLEVEAALESLDEVNEAAVTEEKVSESLSIIAAYIIPSSANLVIEKQSASKAGYVHLEQKIRRILGNKLASYKQPKTYYFVNTLPRSKTGKLLRKDLQKQKPQA